MDVCVQSIAYLESRYHRKQQASFLLLMWKPLVHLSVSSMMLVFREFFQLVCTENQIGVVKLEGLEFVQRMCDRKLLVLMSLGFA